jgi:hypothetical protein
MDRFIAEAGNLTREAAPTPPEATPTEATPNSPEVPPTPAKGE